jgi:conjugal transfer pilus assembly protein TraB
VRDCLVIGEGYGDQSSERAYIRTTTLSCVLQDGHVLEVPLKGQVFGEDGMNGVMGKLVTKQGQMLTNALLSGIASGLGQGLVTATTTTATSPLGTVTSTPNDWSSILQAGAGAGVAKALDRLSQYYISLAEKTFPVIEVLPGRTVDIVVTQGVQLDAPLAVGTSAEVSPRGSADRTALMDTLQSAP